MPDVTGHASDGMILRRVTPFDLARADSGTAQAIARLHEREKELKQRCEKTFEHLKDWVLEGLSAEMKKAQQT